MPGGIAGGSPTKRCVEDGCDRLVRARDRCGGHYDAHRRAIGLTISVQRVEVPCAQCGSTTQKAKAHLGRYGASYCSLACAGQARWLTSREIVGPIEPRWTPIPSAHPARISTPPPRRLTAGYCIECRDGFIDTMPHTRYCSRLCNTRWHRREGKRRRGRNGIRPEVRAFVYARDGGVCQLCHEPVDLTLSHTHAWGPTVDHVVCQSWVVEPDHSPGNLRLAHRMCNSIRGDQAEVDVTTLAALLRSVMSPSVAGSGVVELASR